METMSTSVKETALIQKHEKLGARMVTFAGYRMPVQYSGILPEHRAVRSSVGIFDLSHMGEIEVAGPGMLEFLERVTTNDVASVATFQAQYTLMLNEEGGIIDDLVLYHLPGKAFLVVNAANTERVFAWLSEHKPDSVQLKNRSDELSLIAVQGPKTEAVVGKMVSYDLAQIPFYNAAVGNADGTPILISRTGYTGEDGFEIYMPNDLAMPCWDAAIDAGEEFGILPIGLGARDTLRLEMKYALHGQDIDETTNPYEAGLGWTVRPDKDVPFIGRDAVVAVKETGPSRKLTAFVMDERAIPRTGCGIRVNGEPVGKVTSGSHSPSLDKGIGLGYIATPHSKPDTKIEIVIRDKNVPATVIKAPFVKNTSRRKS
jgi:aminomethyltransferase